MTRLYMYEDVRLASSAMLPHNAVILMVTRQDDNVRIYYSVENPNENRKRCMYTPCAYPFPFYIGKYELETLLYTQVIDGELLVIFRTDNDPEAPCPEPVAAQGIPQPAKRV